MSLFFIGDVGAVFEVFDSIFEVFEVGKVVFANSLDVVGVDTGIDVFEFGFDFFDASKLRLEIVEHSFEFFGLGGGKVIAVVFLGFDDGRDKCLNLRFVGRGNMVDIDDGSVGRLDGVDFFFGFFDFGDGALVVGEEVSNDAGGITFVVS